VQIEGLVLLRIIKHCQTHYPQKQAVAGQLLGVLHKSVLEVTNCFPSLLNATKSVNAEYLRRMTEFMVTVREDSNAVGWYRSAIDGLIFTPETIEGQFNLQKQNPAAVLIMYDPSATTRGRLVLRSFRLSDKFMTFYESKEYSASKIQNMDMSSKEIFQELPLKVHNSHLVHGFLFELRESKAISCEFERLHHSHANSLVNNLRSLATCIDEYGNESQKFKQYWTKLYKKKKLREAQLLKQLERQKELRSQGRRDIGLQGIDEELMSEPEPPRLDSIALSTQMHHHTSEVEQSVLQGLSKLWLTQGLHQDEQMSGS